MFTHSDSGGTLPTAGFLEVTQMSKDFGGLHVLAGLDLSLGRHDLLCVIGPNGCGKTTLFNLLTGLLRPSAGAIRFDGHDLTRLRPFEIAGLGVGRKFQVPSVYESLTVAENFQVALPAAAGRRGLRGLARRLDAAKRARIADALELTGLTDKATWPAGTLAHGEKQWLEIGMVVIGGPRLMLLDEPTAGMTRGETARTAELIRRIHGEARTAMILIEHDMHFVAALDSEVAVMMGGHIIAQGSYDEVRSVEAVRSGYLGRTRGQDRGEHRA